MQLKAQNLKNARVLVVGDVMLDRYWFGEVSRISPEAPVPVVKVGRTEERLGGAANVARNIVAVGGQASLLSVVGQDEAGECLQRLLESEGIIAQMHRDPGLATTIKLRVIGRQQQLLRIDFETEPGHEVLMSKLADFEARLPQADVVILSDYGKGGLRHIERMIELARAAGKPVLVDPKGDDYGRYRGATLLTPNRTEFREVAGRWKSEDDLTERAQKMRRNHLPDLGRWARKMRQAVDVLLQIKILHCPAAPCAPYWTKLQHSDAERHHIDSPGKPARPCF